MLRSDGDHVVLVLGLRDLLGPGHAGVGRLEVLVLLEHGAQRLPQVPHVVRARRHQRERRARRTRRTRLLAHVPAVHVRLDWYLVLCSTQQLLLSSAVRDGRHVLAVK